MLGKIFVDFIPIEAGFTTGGDVIANRAVKINISVSVYTLYDWTIDHVVLCYSLDVALLEKHVTEQVQDVYTKFAHVFYP